MRDAGGRVGDVDRMQVGQVRQLRWHARNPLERWRAAWERGREKLT